MIGNAGRSRSSASSRRGVAAIGMLAAAVVALCAAALAGSAPAQYDPNAPVTSEDIITSVTYGRGSSLSASWTNPEPDGTAWELHAGYTLDARGVVELGAGSWDGSIWNQSHGTSPVTFHQGDDSTIGQLAFTKDFYVQIWFQCFGTNPGRYCAHTSDRGPGYAPEFYSKAHLVHVAGSSGGSSGGSKRGGTATGAVQLASGSAQITSQGKTVRCTTSAPCPVKTFGVGDVVSTGAETYLQIKTKGWGTVRVGPNSSFMIGRHFADFAGGAVEVVLGKERPERLYVAPIPPLSYTGQAPSGAIAGVEPAPGSSGLDFFESVSTPLGQRNTHGSAYATVATPTVVVHVIHGTARVRDAHGHSRLVQAGREQKVTGGRLVKPTRYSLVSCDLQSKGFGAFCSSGEGTTGGGSTTPTSAAIEGVLDSSGYGRYGKSAVVQCGNGDGATQATFAGATPWGSSTRLEVNAGPGESVTLKLVISGGSGMRARWTVSYPGRLEIHGCTATWSSLDSSFPSGTYVDVRSARDRWQAGVGAELTALWAQAVIW